MALAFDIVKLVTMFDKQKPDVPVESSASILSMPWNPVNPPCLVSIPLSWRNAGSELMKDEMTAEARRSQRMRYG